MTQVVYGQKGYLGSSMSVRAAEAYEQGEMPISRWTKTAIIQAVKDYCFDFDLAYDPDIENNTKAELVKEFLEYKSWHHSSRTAREVEFFGLNEDSFPTGIRKDAIPMHKLELILDEQRIIDDGLIRIDDVNNYLAKLIVETNGLRREGNFYIEENPEDGLGAITHIALCLSKQNWFRNYVKVLKCYRWNADTQDFDIEDAIQDLIFADFPVS